MDVFDDDLREVLGDLYVEEDAPVAIPVMETAAAPEMPKAQAVKERKAKDNCTDCPFKKQRTSADRLVDMVKWMAICGGISMLMWWFEVNGLMAMEAAYPCILVSAMIGTGGVVWSVK